MPRKLTFKQEKELEYATDPATLIPVTTIWGDHYYFHTTRKPGKLAPLYHQDGRAAIRCTATNDWYREYLHPDNILTSGRHATPAEVAEQLARNEAACHALVASMENAQ